MNKAKAILFNGVHEVGIAEVDIPDPGVGEVLLETLYTCISPGTELRCLAGKQVSDSPWPFIPGYANVGRVVRRGPGVGIPEGSIFLHGGTSRASVSTLWGAHVSLAVRGTNDLLPLPDGMDLVSASVSRLAAIAYHGMRMANPRPDETVAAVGLGPIGMLSALAHHLSGARLIAYDLSPERVALARSLGLDAHVAGKDLAAAAKAHLPDGADVVVDSTGVPAVLLQSSLLGRVPGWGKPLRDRPRLVLQGSYAGEFTLGYNDVFMREYQILMPRDADVSDATAVIDLIARGRLPVRGLVGKVAGVGEAPEIYRALQEQQQGMLTAVFDWGKA